MTTIEWTDESWNPVTGCAKVSEGCRNCYAESNAKRFWGKRQFTDVMMHPEKLAWPLDWVKPRKIFVNSMSDLFHERVSDEFIWAVFKTMEMAKHHTFQILTKRPERMMALMGGSSGTGLMVGSGMVLPNVWLGVSCEDQKAANERIPLLLQVPAAVRWISAEPLLGPIDLENIAIKSRYHPPFGPKIDWVVCGGESGHKARPMHPDWARLLRHQCQSAGVPFFFKQWGAWRPHPIPPKRGKYTGAGIFLNKAGRMVNQGDYWDGIAAAMDKVGKKEAGRLLDGREWSQFPKAAL